jgi:hypothetical protein
MNAIKNWTKYIGRKVKYVGEMDYILSEIEERDFIYSYLQNVNEFTFEGIETWTMYNHRISLKINDNDEHVFFVAADQIQLI